MSRITHHQGVCTGPAHLVGAASRDIAAFYEAEWPRSIALTLPQFYHWQFLLPPENEGCDQNIVSICDGKILGVMGLNRRTFVLEGETLNAAELTTWVVSSKARGRGIGRQIMQSLKEEYDFMSGFGISPSAMPIYMMEGFRHLARIPRYIRVLDIDAVQSVGTINYIGEQLAKKWKNVAFPKYDAKRCAAASLERAAQFATKDANMYIRDGAALAWRYDEHPVFDYQAHLVKARQGGGTGMGVILRFDEVEGLRFLHVVDLFGDIVDLAATIGFVDDAARENGCAFADLYHCRGAIGAQFLSHGWFSINDDVSIQLPHLFYPVELRSPATTSAVVWSRKNTAGAWDFGRLHLCKGDLDLDRPTIGYYQSNGIELA